jgi:acyl CoA:acetate/3-ketoacid CoA transferase
LDRYTGTFTAGKSKLVIERTETRLTIKQDDRPTATYTPISESRFSSVTPQDESLATFTMAEGKATQIRLRGIGRETTFERGK